MKRTGIVVLALWLVMLIATVAVAQDWEVVEDHEWCKKRGIGTKVCEVREVTLPAWEELSVKTTNGSIHVESWNRDEIRVVARIRVKGGSGKSARETLERVKLYASEDGIYVKGPKRDGIFSFLKGKEWSVSFRVYLPEETHVAARTTNGSITIEGVEGDIDFRTTNGGIEVVGAAGNVSGGTTNGGVKVLLAARGFHGESVDLHTTNGGIKLGLPEGMSARIDASTVNGGVSVDHPVKIHKKSRRRFQGTIGSGDGLQVRARTTNGGVRLLRLDT